MKELKEKGYELDMTSNINIFFLNELQNNHKYQHTKNFSHYLPYKKAVDHSCYLFTKINQQTQYLLFPGIPKRT